MPPTSEMSLNWSIAPCRDFRRHADPWDRLNLAHGRQPCLSSAFIGPLLQHFSDTSPVIALGQDGRGQLLAAALLQPRGPGRWDSFQPSQLPHGAWIAPTHSNLDELTTGLLQALPGFALGMGLTQLDPWLNPRPADNPRLKTLDYIQSAWIDVNSTWEEYWEARGKNLRGNMRKQRSKLEADGVALHFDIITRPEEVPAAIAAYGQLESAGWKAGMGTAVDPASPQGRFYIDMLQGFCATGQGQIWQLKFGDTLVAMDLCIELGDTLVILKTAYDPQYRVVSPAFLLKQEAFQRTFNEGRVRRIEFYGRLMEWHTRWTTQSRTLYHANIYRWALVPRVHGQVKRWLGRTTTATHESSADE